MKSSCSTYVALMFVGFIFVACDQKDQDPNKETFVKGSSTLCCDVEILALIQPQLLRFQALHSDAHLDVSTVDARECMVRLLGAKTRLAVIARGYRMDEDSLMKAFHVKAHRSFHLATDALVFFTQKDFPTDTLSVEALDELMSSGISMQKRIGNLHFDPQFALPAKGSSIVSNLEHFCSRDSMLSKNVTLRYYSDVASVKEVVAANKQTIGVGYLSQLIADTARFKLLGIKYTDKENDRRSMKVEQSAVYREMYPYAVKIVAYLLEDLRNFPMGVASYLAFDAEPQAEFLKRGIVPAYARIKLYQEE